MKLLPGSEGPVGGDLPGHGELVAPPGGVPVLLLLLSHGVVVGAQTLRPGTHVFRSVNNILLIGPGVLTGTDVGPQAQSQADQ